MMIGEKGIAEKKIPFFRGSQTTPKKEPKKKPGRFSNEAIGKVAMSVSIIDTRLSQMLAMLPASTREGKDLPCRSSLLTNGGRGMAFQRVKDTTQEWSAEGMAQVEVLRVLVSTGCYRVDSLALARCILISETRFL
jgi:hypothetical protein